MHIWRFIAIKEVRRAFMSVASRPPTYNNKYSALIIAESKRSRRRRFRDVTTLGHHRLACLSTASHTVADRGRGGDTGPARRGEFQSRRRRLLDLLRLTNEPRRPLSRLLRDRKFSELRRANCVPRRSATKRRRGEARRGEAKRAVERDPRASACYT